MNVVGKRLSKMLYRSGKMAFTDGTIGNTGSASSCAVAGACGQPIVSGDRVLLNCGTAPVLLPRSSAVPVPVEPLPGAMIIIRNSAGDYLHYWFSTDFSVPEEERVVTVSPLNGPNAPGLPPEYTGDNTLYPIGEGMELCHNSRLITKDIELNPADWPEDFDFGVTLKRKAYLLGAPYYAELSYDLVGFSREVKIEKRPRTWNATDGLPQYAFPSVQLNDRFGVLAGSYLNSQDPLASQPVPGAMNITDTGGLWVLKSDIVGIPVRNAESVYNFGASYEPVQAVHGFSSLTYNTFSPNGTLENSVLLDDLYTVQYSSWPYKIGIYNTPPGNFANDEMRVPVRAVFNDDSVAIVSLVTTGEGDKELYTGEIRHDFSARDHTLSSEYGATVFRLDTEDTDNGQKVLNTKYQDADIDTEILKRKELLSSVKTVWDNGAESFYQTVRHTVEIRMGGIITYSFSNESEGWFENGSISVSGASNTRCALYPEVLDVVTYAQTYDDDVKILVFSIDEVIYRSNDSAYDPGPTTVTLGDGSTYDATEINTFRMTWKSEIKFYVGIDGTHIPIVCPPDVSRTPGVVYDREQVFISEKAGLGTSIYSDDNLINGTYSNDGDTARSGVEIRDVSVSKYGDLLLVTFLLAEVYQEKPEWYPGSYYRNIAPSAVSTETLTDRIYQFYSIPDKTILWTGRIVGDGERLTAGFVDLQGIISDLDT